MRPGAYTFELRRWPREEDLGLAEGIEGPPQEGYGEMTYELSYGGGKALPIATAELEVGGRSQTQPVAADQKGATFTVELQAGPTDLRTRFGNDRGLDLGAYYVYVQLEEPGGTP